MKEHIKRLEHLFFYANMVHDTSITDAPAIRAAIELMRAAEPTSEREEDGIVSRAAYRVATAGTQHACDVAQMVKEERARVRAELLPRFKEQERLSLAIIADRDAQIAELKRAAVPLDEAAERGICLAAASEVAGNHHSIDLDEVADLLFDERAQARAEGFADGAQRGFNMGEMRHIERAENAEAQLSAAQAEIERLKQERDVMAFERDTHLEANQERIATLHTNGVQSLNKQVTELQAEIEQAGRDLREEIARCDTLETKLQNLRTAAERAKRELEHSHSHGSHKAIPMLAAAIEASR